jgi:hypothetical protein
MNNNLAKISLEDWIGIGNSLSNADSDFSKKSKNYSLSKKAEKEANDKGLLKESAWYNPFSWAGGKKYDQVDFKNMQWDLDSQDNLIKLHKFINQNPNIIKMVPRLAEVQTDIAQAVQNSQSQQGMMDRYYTRRQDQDLEAKKAKAQEAMIAEQKAKQQNRTPAQNAAIQGQANSIMGNKTPQIPTSPTQQQATPTQQQATPTQQIPKGYETIQRADNSFSRKIPGNETSNMVNNKITDPFNMKARTRSRQAQPQRRGGYNNTQNNIPKNLYA